jgi:hypothetical protein
VVAAGLLSYTVMAKPVPYVSGYREAAQVVIDRAAPGSVVLFSGERDGSFIFNVRANGFAKDLTVLRADKLLLRVTQRRDLGIVDRGFSASQIATMLHEYGVEYAVSDPRFWDDLRSMRELQAALRENFQEIGVVKVTSNVPHKDHELHIYRTLKPPVARAVRIRLDLPIIDTSIEGNLGHSGR